MENIPQLQEAKPSVILNQWRPIEAAPKDGTYILGLGLHNSRSYYVECIYYWGNRWSVQWMDGYSAPTHWMPLPTRPTEEPHMHEENPQFESWYNQAVEAANAAGYGPFSAAECIRMMDSELRRARAAMECALGYLTGNMDGDMGYEADPRELLRQALNLSPSEIPW